MEWRKVKNIIILILLLVNGFLLVIVGTRRGEVRRYEQAALDQAIQVLEAGGIRVSREHVAAADGLSDQTAERSIAEEQELARILLDEEVTGNNRGGGLYIYQGSLGNVSFRAGGTLNASLGQDPRWQAAEPQTMVLQLLSDMGIDAEVTASRVDGGSGTVTARQLWQGVPLYSCQLVFTFRDGSLTAISGQLLTAEEGMEEESELLTLPTALIRFLDEILASGDVCSQVLSMKPGYRMTQSFSGAVYLNPVWLISSNTADYYMDAVTGELSRQTGD